MRGRSLLLVDDDSFVLDSLRRGLQAEFDVDSTTSPAVALELLRSAPDRYFAIVSAARLAGMDGAALLAEAERIAPRSARLLMSDDAKDAAQASGMAVVLRPLAPKRGELAI